MKKNILILILSASLVSILMALLFTLNKYNTYKFELDKTLEQYEILQKNLNQQYDEVKLLEKKIETLQVHSNKSSEKYLPYLENHTYVGTKDFIEQIDNNPIDNQIPIFDVLPVTESVPYYLMYKSVWEEQILFTMKELEEYLSKADYEKLIKINESYFNYDKSSLALEYKLYSVDSTYRFHNGEPIPYPAGSLSHSYLYIGNASRTKQRAVELLGYLYTFTSTVEFIDVDSFFEN